MWEWGHLIAIKILCLRNLTKDCFEMFSYLGVSLLMPKKQNKVQKSRRNACQVWLWSRTDYELSTILMHKGTRPFIFISVMKIGHRNFLELLRWSPTCYWETMLDEVWVEGSSSHSQIHAQVWHAGLTEVGPRDNDCVVYGGSDCSVTWWPQKRWPKQRNVKQGGQVFQRIAAKLILVNHNDLGKWFRCHEASILTCLSPTALT